MGRRGPAPTPTAILGARGSPRAKYSRSPNEPMPEQGAPDRPKGVTGQAAKVWDALAGVVAKGVLTRDNGETLSRYCCTLVRWWKLQRWVQTNPNVYTVKDALHNTRYHVHPNVNLLADLGRDLLRMEQEFGLTPASRTRVETIVATPVKAKAKEHDSRDPAAAPVLRPLQIAG